MMDEIKGYSILGFVICFQNVSILNHYHLLRSAEKLLQNLCNISEYICINKLGRCPPLERTAANSVEELTQCMFLQMKKLFNGFFVWFSPSVLLWSIIWFLLHSSHSFLSSYFFLSSKNSTVYGLTFHI